MVSPQLWARGGQNITVEGRGRGGSSGHDRQDAERALLTGDDEPQGTLSDLLSGSEAGRQTGWGFGERRDSTVLEGGEAPGLESLLSQPLTASTAMPFLSYCLLPWQWPSTLSSKALPPGPADAHPTSGQ